MKQGSAAGDKLLKNKGEQIGVLLNQNTTCGKQWLGARFLNNFHE